MFFLNLSLAEFAGLLGAVSALTVALYLLDRSRRRQVVATLRFWIAAGEPSLTRHRRRIQQPWSLVLQLAAVALLLAAIAELRLGAPAAAPWDHVLLVDTSAWMAARVDPSRTLMDLARERASRYLDAVAPGDRIMLVRADGLATPATVFESNRDKLRQALADCQPAATALDLDQAFEFARRVQSLSAGQAGEIVFVGAGRIPERQAAGASPVAPDNLRVLALEEHVENCGIRKVGLRRSAAEPDLWEIYVSARNYGTLPKTVAVTLAFGGAPAGFRRLNLKPGVDQEAVFEYRTRAAGELEARLEPGDALPGDNRAVLELPQQRTLAVIAWSDEPDLLRPLLVANPRVSAVIRPTAQYDPRAGAPLVVLDRFRPAALPAGDSIWIEPPALGSPVPVRSRRSGLKLTRWNPAHPLAAGLRTADLKLDEATVFEAAPGDVRIAESDAGPVAVARPGKPKIVVLGFHPSRTAMRYELATPLLFANILRWMAPDIFRRWELTGGSAGMVDLALEPETRPESVHLSDAAGNPVPFSIDHETLHFFAGSPGTVLVNAGDRELVYSSTLPELSESRWTPPPQARRGLAGLRRSVAGSRGLWPLLAVLGALGLLAEWILYGRYRRAASVHRASWRLILPGTKVKHGRKPA